MRKIAVILIIIFCSGMLFAEDSIPIVIEKMPETIEEFLSLRDSLAKTPEGGAAIFVVAMLMYEKDEKLGMDAITIALDRSQLQESRKGYKGFSPSRANTDHIERYLRGFGYIARSYIQGTSPDNQYTIPSGSMTVIASYNPYSDISETEQKVFIDSTGADSPRPVYMRVNNRGIWKVYNHSLILGVRPPVIPIDDTL